MEKKGNDPSTNNSFTVLEEQSKAPITNKAGEDPNAKKPLSEKQTERAPEQETYKPIDLQSFQKDAAGVPETPESSQLKSLADPGPEIVMDEEMSELDLGDLDLLGMEYACTRKASSSIPLRQIQLLKEAVVNDKAQNKLGVQNTPKKEKQKAQRDNRKWGRKTDL